MRRIVLAALAVSAFSAGAIENLSAQDILRMMYSPVPIINWTGFYVGGNFGYGWARTTDTPNGILEPQGSWHQKGVLGGVQGGFNIQSGMGVFGFETDFQLTAQKATTTTPGSFLGLPVTFNDTYQVPWFGTARARAGVAADRVFIYGTGGLAYGEIRSDRYISGSVTGIFHHSQVRFGWVAGAGVEMMTTPNWTWRFEYLHYDLGSFDQVYIVTVGGTSTNVMLNSRFTNDLVRVGVNYIIR